MASDIDFVGYVMSQMSGVGIISQKRVFGEYMIYVNQKPMVLVCDNEVYVRKLDCLKEFLGTGETGYPYDGAKEHYKLDADNSEMLKKIVLVLEKIT